MNPPTIPLLATTMSVALVAPSNVAAALLQAQPKVQVVVPPDPNAPPIAVVEPPTPMRHGSRSCRRLCPAHRRSLRSCRRSPACRRSRWSHRLPRGPPALAVIPPNPNAPPVAVVPPPGGEVRVVIPVAADSVAGLPDCSSTVRDALRPEQNDPAARNAGLPSASPVSAKRAPCTVCAWRSGRASPSLWPNATSLITLMSAFHPFRTLA